MADKMLVTQPLDERDLLVKKIQDKIEKASFVDTVKPNEENGQHACMIGYLTNVATAPRS